MVPNLKTTSGHVFDVDGILFDKDGTLVDLDATWAQPCRLWIQCVAGTDSDLLAELASVLGFDLDLDRIVPDGVLAAQPVQAMLDHTWEVVRELDDRDQRITRAMMAFEAHDIVAVPLGDVLTPLSALRESGMVMAMVTNDDSWRAKRAVSQLGLDRVINVVVGGDLVQQPKPAAAPILAAAAELGVPPPRLVFVGDSISDVTAARAAGCAGVIGLSRNGHSVIGADATITALTDLSA